MNNSEQRLHDVFFYGLYMDEDILRSKNVEPRDRRIAVAHGYELRIGKMATLLRKDAAEAYGIVYALTHEEIDLLYLHSGLTAYASEALMVQLQDGASIAVLCSNLRKSPANDECNDAYYQKLVTCMKRYKLPLPKRT